MNMAGNFLSSQDLNQVASYYQLLDLPETIINQNGFGIDIFCITLQNIFNSKRV